MCVYCIVYVCIHKYTAACLYYTLNNEGMSTEHKQVSISLELVLGLNQIPTPNAIAFGTFEPVGDLWLSFISGYRCISLCLLCIWGTCVCMHMCFSSSTCLSGRQRTWLQLKFLLWGTGKLPVSSSLRQVYKQHMKASMAHFSTLYITTLKYYSCTVICSSILALL